MVLMVGSGVVEDEARIKSGGSSGWQEAGCDSNDGCGDHPNSQQLRHRLNIDAQQLSLIHI